MIVDDAEGFLRFLDNVGVQLASLLDTEGRQVSGKRSRHSARCGSAGKLRTGVKPQSKQASNSKTQNSISNAKRHQSACKSSAASSTRANRVRGRRKQERVYLGDADEGNQESSPPLSGAQDVCSRPTGAGSPATLAGDSVSMVAHLDSHSHYITESPVKLHTNQGASAGDTQLDSQLSLTLPDDLAGSSISPVTQLSPIDQSIQPFGSASLHQHQQHHYYTPRAHLVDPYHAIQDEFGSIGGHDANPITDNSSPHLLGQAPTIDQVHRQLALGANQQLPTNTLQEPPTSDCYPHHPLNHPLSHNNNHQQQQQQHHQQHHHHHHHHHHQHEPHHHQIVQFHHLDQPGWLCSAGIASETSLQAGNQPPEPDALEHVVPFSPGAHQTLDQVPFGGSLYHPATSYYGANHSEHHLDTFQHIGADHYGPVSGNGAHNPSTTGVTPTTESLATGAHLHRLINHDQPPSSGSEQQSLSGGVKSSLEPGENTANIIGYQREPQHQNYLQNQTHHSQSADHNLTSIDQQQHQHLQHQQDSTNYSSHQSVHLATNSASHTNNHHNHHSHHHQHSHPQQHHHHHQHHHNHHSHHLNQSHHLLPLINGLEPSGVIIQDINLASASWSSPEDLYSI